MTDASREFDPSDAESLRAVAHYFGMDANPDSLDAYGRNMSHLLADIASLADEDAEDQSLAAVFDARWR